MMINTVDWSTVTGCVSTHRERVLAPIRWNSLRSSFRQVSPLSRPEDDPLACLISPDSVHRRNATLRGSMRRSSRMSVRQIGVQRWQLLQSGTE